MITLDNFENFVPYKILMRGEEYYDTDAVSELEETSPGEWTATVEGTDDYNVEISMNGKEVESWYCDCPYDGEICKHVVAALLEDHGACLVAVAPVAAHKGVRLVPVADVLVGADGDDITDLFAVENGL